MNNRIRRTIVAMFALSAIMLVSLAAHAAVGQQVMFTYRVTNPSSAETVEQLATVLDVPAGEPLTLIATNLQTGETASHRINPANLTLKRGVMSASAFAGQTIRIRIVAADASTVYQKDLPAPTGRTSEAYSFWLWVE